MRHLGIARMDAPEIVLLCFGGFALFFGILGCLALLTRHGDRRRKVASSRLPAPDVPLEMKIEDYGSPKANVVQAPVYLQSSEDSVSYAVPRSQLDYEEEPIAQFSRAHRKSLRYQSFLESGQAISQATVIQPRVTVVDVENDLIERRNQLYRRDNEERKSILKREPKIDRITEEIKSRQVKRPMKLPEAAPPEATNANAVRTEHSIRHLESDLDRVGRTRTVLFADEFEVLNKLEEKRTRTKEIGKINKEKNRYADVLPYDENIVDSDSYINASFIQSNGKLGRYIATQGPLDSSESDYQTVDDFWAMVWKHDVSCIIMLTGIKEDFRQKCGNYFPIQVGETDHLRGLTLRLCSVSDDPYFVHREFDLSNGRKTRMITHYEFKDWSDNEMPNNPSNFLDFVQMIQTKGHKAPIVVHCSAGVGRTGVYIAVANNLERAESEGVVDVFTEVNLLRQQRARMVSTVSQYQSIYQLLLLFANRCQFSGK